MDYPPALLNIQGIKGLAARHPVPHTTGVSVPRTIYYYSLGAALLLLLYLLAYRYRRSTGFLLGKLYTGNTGILSFILAWLRLASSWVLSLLHRPTPKELGGSQVQHSTGPPAPLVMVVNARSGNGQGKLVTDAVQGLLMERGPGGVLEVLPLSLEGLAAALRRVREVLGISGGSGSGEAGTAIAAAGDGSVATAGAGSSPNSSSSSSSSFSPTTLGPHSPLLPPLPVRLVCAGGDGTVSAVAGVLNACGLSRVPLAVLPLGTGNDMARSLGMGGSPPPLDAPTLGAWLARVSTAPVTPCDVWSVSFGVHPGGSIRVLRHGVETALHETSVRGSGVLYCSTGLDARLVWEVERRRSGSRWANRALYALLGAGLVVGGSFSNAWEAVRGCWRRRRGRGGWCGCWSSTTTPMQQQQQQQQQQHYPPFTSFLESLSMDNHALGGSGGGEPGLTFGGKLPPLQSLIAVSSPSYAGGTNLWPSTWTLSPFNFRSYFTPLHHLRQQQGGGGHQGKVPPPPPLPPSPSSPSGGRSSLEQQGTTAVAAAAAAKPQPSSVSRASNRPPLWAMALKHQAATLTADVSWALSLAFPCAPRAVVMAWGAWLGSHTPPSLTLWAMGCLPWCCKRGGARGVGGLTLDSQPLPPPPPPPAVLGAGLERGWLAQSMSDGHMELIGVSSLFSISGAIGLRCGILGGLHRLGQPSSLNLTWPPPDINLIPSASSSSSSAAVQGGVSSPRSSSLTFLVAAVARSLEGIRRWWGEGMRRFRWGGYSGGGGGGSGGGGMGMGGALAPRRGGKGHGVGGTPGSSSFHKRRKSRVGRRITRWRDEVEAEYEGEEEDEEGGARGRRERDIERGEGEVESYEEYEEDEDREGAEEEEEEEVLDLVYPTTPGPPPSRFRSMSPFPHLRIPSILRMAGSAVKGIRAKVGLRTLLRRGRRRLLGEKVPAPPVWAPPEDFEGDAESLLGGGAGGGGGDSDSLRSRSVSPEETNGGKRGGFATLHRAQLAPPPPTPQWRVVNERGGLDTPAPPPATVTAAASTAPAVQVAVVGTPGVTEESGGKEGHGHSQTNSTAATATTTTTTTSSSSEPPPPLSTPTGTVVYLQVDGEAYKLDSPSFLTIEYSGKVYFVRF